MVDPRQGQRPRPGPGRGPTPAAAPDGQLYVLYLDLGDDRLDYAGAHQGRGGDPYQGTWSLILAHSADRGQTWQDTTVDDAVQRQPFQRFMPFCPDPHLAVDPRSGRHGDVDVWIWTSADDGATFTARQRVNDTPVGDGTARYLPKLAVAPDGRLDIIYYDRRDDRADIVNQVSLQSSRNHGRTFSPRVRISGSGFDSRVGPGSERNLADLGSRIALVSSTGRALAVWTDSRAVTDVTSKQDLARAIVQTPAPRQVSAWWRALSLILIAAGAATATGAARRRRKGSPRSCADKPGTEVLDLRSHAASVQRGP